MTEKQLIATYLAAVEAHKQHAPRLRLDGDGIYRCPACYPVASWRRLTRVRRTVLGCWAALQQLLGLVGEAHRG